jgi:hypothetical protein
MDDISIENKIRDLMHGFISDSASKINISAMKVTQCEKRVNDVELRVFQGAKNIEKHLVYID